MDEAIKILLPWGLIAFWAVNLKSLKGQRLNTLFFTIFAGFSANFTAGYREIYQGFSILLALIWLLHFLRSMKVDRWNLYFLAFYGTAIISLVFGGISEDSITAFTNLTLMFFISNFMIGSLKNEYDIKTILGYLQRISVFMSIFAIFEFASGMRSELTFSNPNYFAVYLIPGLAWSLLSIDSKPKWISFILISTAIYASGSRSALAAAPIAIAIYYMRTLADTRQTNFFRMIVLSVFLTAISVAVGGEKLLNAGRTSEAVESSDNERIVVIEVASAMLKEHPIIGIGWGKFAESFSDYVLKSKSFMPNSPSNLLGVRDYIVTHNDYVRVASELGLIGFLIFMIIIFKSHSDVVSYKSNAKYALLAIFYGILFFSVAHNNMNSAQFWFFIMLPFALKKIQSVSRPAE